MKVKFYVSIVKATSVKPTFQFHDFFSWQSLYQNNKW